MTVQIIRGLVDVRAEAGTSEVRALVDEVNKAFDTFKAEHTKQIDSLKKGHDDALQALKVDRINADIDRLQKEIEDAHVKIAASQNASVGGRKVRDAEYTDAFNAHFKKGEIHAALNKGASDEGGYLAPSEWDRTIADKLVLVSPMRQICLVQPTSKANFKKLFNLKGATSGWVGETAARPATSNPTFAELEYTTGEIYANPAATQQILDDAEIDIETWLAGEVQQEFAFQEGAAFVSGNGTNKPTGILTYVTGGTNAAKHPYGAIAAVNSGSATAITADGIIDLIYDLPSVYTGNARFTMNRKTQGFVRKLKDGQGNYLWQPSYVAGQPATLCNFPITEIPDMPDVAANALPIMFGDFNKGYMILDRTGVRVLRDPYTNKPYVSFYTTKRVGGGLLDPQPLRALKVAAGA